MWVTVSIDSSHGVQSVILASMGVKCLKINAIVYDKYYCCMLILACTNEGPREGRVVKKSVPGEGYQHIRDYSFSKVFSQINFFLSMYIMEKGLEYFNKFSNNGFLFVYI